MPNWFKTISNLNNYRLHLIDRRYLGNFHIHFAKQPVHTQARSVVTHHLFYSVY